MANLSQDDRQTVPEDQGSRGLVHRVLDLGIGGLGLGIYALQGDLPSWNGLGPSGPASQAEEAATSPSHEEETAGTGPVINLMVGAASTTASAIGMGVSAAGKVTKGVWRVTAPLRWPLEALGITDMAERTAEVVAEIGRMELQHGTSFALGLVADTIDSIVAYLAHSPAVDALIESQVDKIIPMLAEHPAVAELVETQINLALPELTHNPAVAELVQGQVDQILPELSQSLLVTELVRAQIDRIVPELAQSPAITDLILAQVDRVLAQLIDNPAVAELVRAQVERILPEIAQSPAVTELIQAQVDRVVPELANDPAITELIQAQVDRVVPELANDPAIAALVQAQVNQIVPLLAQDPVIQELIRQQGDAYIDYLNENPDAVQNLIQGQSVGLASDVLDGVRERTVTADSLAESIVRGLLGRKPRGDVPEPPEQIQRRAVSAMLPSDYVEEGDR